MNKLSYTLAGCIGLLTVAPSAGKAEKRPITKHPNIIYVFPDQFRNMAMGFWNEAGFKEAVNFRADPVYTPVLNNFAKESFVLSSAMSNCPLSSPHRGSLLTGMYPNKSGVSLNCNSNRPVSSLRTDAECVSDIFHQSGYDCAYFGKLHADFPTPDDPENPGYYVEKTRPAWDTYTPQNRRHGFNYWYSYGTYDVHKNPHYWDTEGKKHEPKEWSPLHEAKQVIAYLQNKEKQRDSDKPFFIMVGMNPPHSPYRSLNDCMEEDYNLYKDMPLDSLLIRPNADKKRAKSNSVRYYFASVTGVDRAFGQILDCLKELNLDENTIVVFSSDHGETMCSQYTDDPKNSPYEESMNVPFLVRYPNHIRPRIDNLLLSSPDIMPTLLGLCKLDKKIPNTVQGQNYAPLILEKGKAIKRPSSALYIQNIDGDKNKDGLVTSYFPKARGLRTSHYTLALYINKENKLVSSQLFDDIKDPYQMNNLSLKDHKGIAQTLFRELAAELKKIDDPWYRDKVLADLLPY